MNKLFDLRFVIGAFFAIIGLLLIAYSLITTEGRQINLICGGIFVVFGIVMIAFSARNKE
jgi:hypothetical protein